MKRDAGIIYNNETVFVADFFLFFLFVFFSFFVRLLVFHTILVPISKKGFMLRETKRKKLLYVSRRSKINRH